MYYLVVYHTYVCVCIIEKTEGRGWGRCTNCWFTNQTSTTGRSGPSQSQGLGIQIWVSHTAGRGPSPWAITCCFSGNASAGSWRESSVARTWRRHSPVGCRHSKCPVFSSCPDDQGSSTSRMVSPEGMSETKQLMLMTACVCVHVCVCLPVVKTTVLLADINDFGTVNDIYKQCK